MSSLLFINACVRGQTVSRTYRLCKVFLDAYLAANPDTELDDVDLTISDIPRYHAAAIERRDALIDAGKLDDEMFGHAKQFAAADRILVGAPHWDLSFPAILKSYIEHVSVRDVTFATTPTGVRGICRAQALVYVTTVGGKLEGADHGAEYFKGLCGFYGISRFEVIRAQGLDLEGSDPAAIMQAAGREAASLAGKI